MWSLDLRAWIYPTRTKCLQVGKYKNIPEVTTWNKKCEWIWKWLKQFIEEENISDEYFWDANSISDKTSYSQELTFIFLGWDISSNRLSFHFIYSKYNFISSEIWMSVVVSVICISERKHKELSASLILCPLEHMTDWVSFKWSIFCVKYKEQQ